MRFARIKKNSARVECRCEVDHKGAWEKLRKDAVEILSEKARSSDPAGFARLRGLARCEQGRAPFEAQTSTPAGSDASRLRTACNASPMDPFEPAPIHAVVKFIATWRGWRRLLNLPVDDVNAWLCASTPTTTQAGRLSRLIDAWLPVSQCAPTIVLLPPRCKLRFPGFAVSGVV